MKKALAFGGIGAVPLLLLAVPLAPQVAVILGSLGFGILTLSRVVVLGLLAVLGSFFGDGNLLAALIAFA
jgi:hypothetical protein